MKIDKFNTTFTKLDIVSSLKWLDMYNMTKTDLNLHLIKSLNVH